MIRQVRWNKQGWDDVSESRYATIGHVMATDANSKWERRILYARLEKQPAAAPVVPVDIANARRLYHHFANGGTITKEDVSRLVQAIEVRDTQSPAAPGIAASTKDGSDAAAFYDASAKGFHISETCGPDGKYHAVSKFQTLADLHAFEDARRTLLIAERALNMQPTSHGAGEN